MLSEPPIRWTLKAQNLTYWYWHGDAIMAENKYCELYGWIDVDFDECKTCTRCKDKT